MAQRTMSLYMKNTVGDTYMDTHHQGPAGLLDSKKWDIGQQENGKKEG